MTIQTPHEAAFVRGDQKRLVQIVANVLNNAAKYTPEGGDITVALDLDDDGVRFTVSDNGIGLALVKNLVTLHRGRVAAASEGIGKGSRFTVTLPRAAAPAGDTASPLDEMGPADAHGLRLLVVDDNADAGQMLGLCLEAVGYQVTVVQSAHAALESARADPPDVGLLDIGLPDMDGNELARRLRRLPHMASATLIAITGYGQETDRAKTAAAGFDRHFVKPVDMQALLGVLARTARINVA